MSFTFDESTHTYRLDGEELPGVTSVTGVIDKSGPLMWWAVNEARDYIKREMEPGETVDEKRIDQVAESARMAHRHSSQTAANIGTRAHTWMEKYIKQVHFDNGPEPDFPESEEVQESVVSFLDWEENHEVEYMESEVTVYSEEHRYAGTFDLKAWVDGKVLIDDFKTSKSVYDNHWLQLSAYYLADGRDADGIGILHLPKTRSEFTHYTELDEKVIESHIEGFLGARQLYEWQSNQ